MHPNSIGSILFAACLLVAVPGSAQQAQKLAPPDGAGVVILVRSTLSALNDANRTGNYTVLRDLAAPGFRAANSAARLAEIFANLRKKDLNLAPVTVVRPILTNAPSITPNGMLHVAGTFPTRPLNVKFELLYEQVDKEWKLFGIQVDTPAAPQTDRQEPQAKTTN